ncbi:MAG: hypothetical protein ACOH5I_22005 [Oligoflexus sp.]
MRLHLILLSSVTWGTMVARAQESAPNKASQDCDCSRKTFFGITVDCESRSKSGKYSAKPRSITEGISGGQLSPYLELSIKEANPHGEALALRGLRLGFRELGGKSLGLAYYQSDDRIEYNPSTNYQIRYGGFVWGGMPEADGITQFYGSFLLGTGQAKVQTLSETKHTNMLLAIEPEFGLAVNLSSWMQFGIGLSYRYLSGSKVQDFRSENLRGWTANFHLRFH